MSSQLRMNCRNGAGGCRQHCCAYDTGEQGNVRSGQARRSCGGCGRCGAWADDASGVRPNQIQGRHDLHRHRRHGAERRRRRGRSSNRSPSPAPRSTTTSRRRGDIVKAQDADLVLWNGLNLERWFEKFFQQPAATCRASSSPRASSRWASREGPYSGKPNPHAWMSPTDALIYVENIRKALRRSTTRPMPRPTRPTPRPTRRRSRRRSTPIQAKLARDPGGAALAGDQRGRLQLSRPRLRPEGALSLADQRRPAGHAAAGAQGDRRACARTRSRSCSAKARSPTKPAQQVARETGAAYGGVLYVDSLSEADGPVPTYLDLLRVTVRDHRQGPRTVNA